MSTKMTVSGQYRTDVDGTYRRRSIVRAEVTQTVEREAREVPRSDRQENSDASVVRLSTRCTGTSFVRASMATQV